MPRQLLLIAGLVLALGALSAPSARAQQGRAWPGERPFYGDGRDLPPAVLQSLDAMPEGGRFRLDDLVRYDVRRGRVTARFALPAELERRVNEEATHNGGVRLAIDGSTLVWTLRRTLAVRRGAANGGAAVVELTCYGRKLPGEFQCAALTVSDDATTFRGFDFMAPGGQGRNGLAVAQRADDVLLSWRLPPGAGFRQRVPNFAAFEAKYPEPWALYFVPVARRLGLGHLLHRRPAVDVYRAFPEVQPDAATVRHVEDLVAQIDSSDFVERQAANRALAAAGRRAILCLLRLDRATLSPEQSTRVDAILAEDDWRHVPDPAAARRDLMFLLDCLDDEDAAVRASAKAAVSQVLGTPLAFDVAQDPDQRLRAVDALCGQARDAAHLSQSVNGRVP